ncbi:MAG: single-stranded DNA-binding protein [Anaerolineae bacterium]|jgi:single-strand DNA-binding protein|nr:single-stranded DNA-binding protein [Anaerolineae bacterium]
MYQQITIIGNVGRDPEMRYTQGGVAVCDFSVAVNKKYTTSGGEQRDETTWFRVTCWRQLAETMGKYLTKGKQIMVVGEVSASAYTDKAGQPAATLEITANTVKFLGSRQEGDDAGGGNSGGGRSNRDDDFAPRPRSGGGNNSPSNTDDIPF